MNFTLEIRWKITICSLTLSTASVVKKRKKVYIIRDQTLKGFQLKVYPSERKTFGVRI